MAEITIRADIPVLVIEDSEQGCTVDEEDELIADNGPSLKRVGTSAVIYLTLSFMCTGMMMGPLASMFLNRACDHIGLPSDRCKDSVDGVKVEQYDDAQSRATASITGWSLVGGTAQFLMCPLLGMLGDAFGRRLPLVTPLLGGVLSSAAIYIVPAARQNDLLLGIMFVINLLGGQYVSAHACFGTLADVTQTADVKMRAFVFGAVEIGLWLGLIVGPSTGGVLTQYIGDRLTFITIGGVYALNLLITLVSYPETLEPCRRKPVFWPRANPFSSLKMFKEGGRTTALLGLAEMGALVATTGGCTIVPLYAAKWANVSTNSAVWIVSVVAAAGCVGLLFGLPYLSKRIPLQNVLGFCLLNLAACWFATSFMTSFLGLFLVACCQLLSAVFAPIVRAGVVNTFGANRYGEALAAVGSMEQLCYILATQFTTAIYRYTEHDALKLGPIGIHTAAFPAIAVVALLGSWAAFSITEMPVKEDPQGVADDAAKQESRRASRETEPKHAVTTPDSPVYTGVIFPMRSPGRSRSPSPCPNRTASPSRSVSPLDPSGARLSP
eukprot:Hpha_TRINITY_DN15596_c4_g1::TRINITY_DN15596_c4_g1_i1::g.105313::m.105313/K08151/tetA; MFS transporter, DHA1 family, tetracycline resistance protein